MALTKEQFGQKIKAKYPQYENMADLEVAEKTLKKYPQYNDLISEEEVSGKVDTFLESQPILKGIADFVGVKGLAKGMAQGIFLKFTPEGKNLLNLVSQGQLKQEDVEKVIGKTAETSEILGSAAKTALTVGTLGGAGLAGGLARRVVTTAGLGAGFGVAEAIEAGRPEEIPKTALTGAAIGAGISGVGAGLRAVGRGITEFLPTRLVRSVVKQPKKELLAGKDIAPFVLAKRKIGTAGKLIQESELQISTLGQKINQNLGDKTLTKVSIARNEIVNNVVNQLNQTGAEITENEVLGTINQLAPQVKGLISKTSFTPLEANKLRQALDKTLGDRGFLTGQLPFNKLILRTFDNNLREKIKTVAPEGTRELFSELSKEITLRNALLDTTTAQTRNQVISFGDLIGGGLGGLFGGGALGVAAGIATRRAIQAPAVLTTTAVGLSLLKKLQPLLKGLAPSERQLLLQTIGVSEEEITESDTIQQTQLPE